MPTVNCTSWCGLTLSQLCIVMAVGSVKRERDAKKDDPPATRTRISGKGILTKAQRALLEAGVTKEEIADVQVGQLSNYLTQMRKLEAAGKLTPDQEAQWHCYQACGRFDTLKRTIICKWQKDMSAKWFQEITELSYEGVEDTKTVQSGYGTRFQIAAAMQIPSDMLQSEMFQTILATYESDNLRDESLPDQKAYKMAGEKRYNIARIGSLDETKVTAGARSEFKESSSKMAKQGDLSASSKDLVVTVQNQNFVDLTNFIKTLHTGLQLLMKLRNDVEEKLASAEAVCKQKDLCKISDMWVQKWTTILGGNAKEQGLENARKQLAKHIAEAGLLTANDDIPDDYLCLTEAQIKFCEEHTKGVKAFLRDLKAQVLA